jgi:hypothetical protein
MIYKATVIPAQNAVATAIQIGILVRLRFQQRRQRIDARRRNDPIERIARPRDGAFGNQARGEQTIPDCVAHVSKFRMRMNQFNSIPDACRRSA